MATEADFQTAVRQVLAFEGGYVHDPSDPGGATNLGITQRTYDTWREAHGKARQSVAQLTVAEATQIYREWYWQRSGAFELPMPLALIHFDTAVNMGVSAARALLAKSGNDPATYLKLREERYRSLAAANPSLGKFLNGWLKRVATLAQHVGPAPAVVVLGLGLLLWLVRRG